MKDATQDIYRRVLLGSQDGRRVLTHLLADMGFFDTDLKEPGEVAVRNYATKILRHLGIYNINTYDNIVDNLANVVIPAAEGRGSDNVTDLKG